MSTKIKLRPREFFLARGIQVPGYLWLERPFTFHPHDFGIGNEQVKERIVSDDVQLKSLEVFTENPTHPCVYAVASAPSDLKAKMFAAFLIQTYVDNAPPNNIVRWEALTGDFKTPVFGNEPSLLVLTGLTPNSTAVKLEKARDLLEHYSEVPRIVVIAGEDPITFMHSKLYSKPSRIFFDCAASVKRKIETI